MSPFLTMQHKHAHAGTPNTFPLQDASFTSGTADTDCCYIDSGSLQKVVG